VGAVFAFIGLAPIIVGILVLLHIVRTLDSIRTDVRRIAERVESQDSVSQR